MLIAFFSFMFVAVISFIYILVNFGALIGKLFDGNVEFEDVIQTFKEGFQKHLVGIGGMAIGSFGMVIMGIFLLVQHFSK